MVIKSALKDGKGSSERRRRPKGEGGSSASKGIKKMLTYEEEKEDREVLEDKRSVLGTHNGQGGGSRAGSEKKSKDRRMECIEIELKDLQQGTHRLKKLFTNGDAVEEVQKKALSIACKEIERQLAVIKGVLGRPGLDEMKEDVVKTPKSVRFLLD